MPDSRILQQPLKSEDVIFVVCLPQIAAHMPRNGGTPRRAPWCFCKRSGCDLEGPRRIKGVAEAEGLGVSEGGKRGSLVASQLCGR